MATLAKMFVQVGVTLEGSLKVESKIKGLRRATESFAEAANRNMGTVRKAFRSIGRGARQAADRIRGAVKGMVARMGGLRNVALAGAAAIGALAAATFKFVDSQSAMMDQTNKTSQALGVGVEELQRLRFAASQSGVDANTLEKGLQKLNLNMLDMSQGGGKKASDALRELGLTFDELQGKSRTDQLKAIADRLNAVDDSGRKAAIAANLFGVKSGPELSILLAEGSTGIAELTAGAQGVFSQEDADRATEFQDRLGEVKNVVKGLATTLASKLLPIVLDVVVAFRDWITENQNLIAQGMDAVVQSIADAALVLKTAVEAAVWPLQQMVNLFGGAGDKGRIFGDVISALLNPLSTVANGIRLVNEMLAELGVRLLQAEGGGLAHVEQLARQAAQVAAAKAEVSAASEEHSTDFGIRAGGKRGGAGGGAGKAKKKGSFLGTLGGIFGPSKLERRLFGLLPAAGAGGATGPPGVTVNEAVAALLGGRGEQLEGTLKGLAARTPSTADIKPTVAIDFQNFAEGAIKLDIRTSDPVAAGREAAAAIKRAIKKSTALAGGELANKVLR